MKSFDFFLIKREWLVIVIAYIAFQSCNSFKSNDELLTQDKWVLYRRFITKNDNGKPSDKMTLYNKADQALTFDFNKDGTILITEENGSKSATIKWYWKDSKKKYITLDKGEYSGDFDIVKLTGTDLQWSKSDIYSSDITLESFKHLDDSDWK